MGAARAPADNSGRGGFKKNTPPLADAAEILANLVLNHVPVVNYDFRGKVRPRIGLWGPEGGDLLIAFNQDVSCCRLSTLRILFAAC